MVFIVTISGRDLLETPQNAAKGARMVQKVYCTACGCECQFLPAVGWRCPWATSGSRVETWMGGVPVTSCGRPYQRERVMVLPQQTRTR